MRLTVVGCSGSFPGPDSPASCYLVEAPDADGRTWRVLLDLGNGALGALQRHVSPYDVDAVLLSHLHADHCLDLCGMYVALKYRPDSPTAPRRLQVMGPRGTAARLARAYDLPDSPGMTGEMAFGEWVEREPVRIGPFTVTPYLVEHPVEAYGLRVEAGGRVLAYTGDTDACEALAQLAKGADLMLADAAFVEGRDAVRGIHLTGRRAAEAAVAAQAERLVLTHVPPWNPPGVCLEEARAVWAGPLDLASPGATYDV